MEKVVARKEEQNVKEKKKTGSRTHGIMSYGQMEQGELALGLPLDGCPEILSRLMELLC